MNKTLQQIGENACAAVPALQKLTTEDKNRILRACAKVLKDNAAFLLEENEKDLTTGRQNGMAEGLIDRLTLTRERIKGMADGLKQVADLPDPVGEEMESFERPNGLRIKKVRVPIGVIGIIYESRPNVTADAFALCFKTGNATILKGGSDAIHSNIAITKVLRDALSCENAPVDAVQLIADTDRAVTQEFMRMNDYVDVLIPRGSAGLIKATVENATIRLALKCSAVSAGASTFIAQVCASLPCVPNFRPAMKMTLRTCGSFSTCPRSIRSQGMVLIPAFSSLARSAALEKRETP